MPDIMPRKREILRGPLANATVRVAFNELSPDEDEPELPPIATGLFGKTPIVGVTGVFTLRGAALEATLMARAPEGLRTLRALHGRLNEPVSLDLEDGSKVRSPLACCAVRGMDFKADGSEIRAKATLILDNWVHSTAKAPVLWWGRLPRAHFDYGNVWVERGEEGLNGRVLRLVGHYTWHLIKADSTCLVLLDTGDRVPGGRELNADFGALQFTLGRVLRLQVLHGLDDDGRTVARTGVALGFRRTLGAQLHRPPIPPRDQRTEHWAPILFASTARALVVPDSPYETLLIALLDSTIDHLDGAYLKLQVAIEAYCTARTANGGRPPLVRDQPEWEAWVDSHEAEIRAHGRDKQLGQKLLNKIRNNAPQPPSSDAVTDGLATMQLAPPAHLVQETARRNRPVHNFLMNKPGTRDLLEDLARVRRLQALATGLLAHGVGYRGPVVDLADETPWPVPLATWLPATASLEPALFHYICTLPVPPDVR